MKLPPIGEPPTPKTVLLLGAGASTCLGYPTTFDLLTTVEQVARSSSEESFRSAWEEWAAFRDGAGAGATLDKLLLSANPEIALSAIDLMETVLDRGDEGARPAITGARAARNALVQALDRFFVLRHAEVGSRPSSTRDYLRAFFDNYGVEDGDVVITTNWDAVAELTLAEIGLWNPFDGYGFRRRLERILPSSDGPPAPSREKSPVKVLKLHGSFGWRMHDNGLYLDYQDLLGLLPVHRGSHTVTFRDSAAPTEPGRIAPVLGYPSFVKRAWTSELHEVWQLAGEAVRRADTVVVIGHSLPESDLAVRTLLMPLRLRALNKRVKVVVIDRSESTLERWQDLLADHATGMLMNVCDDLAT